MANRSTYLWTGLLVLVGLMSFFLIRSAPFIIEYGVLQSTRNGPFQIKEFSVSHLTMDSLFLGTGSVEADSGKVLWESGRLGYSLSGLMKGEIEALEFDGLQVVVRLPEERIGFKGPVLKEALPKTSVPPPLPRQAEEPIPSRQPMLAVEPFSRIRDYLFRGELPVSQFKISNGILRVERGQLAQSFSFASLLRDSETGLEATVKLAEALQVGAILSRDPANGTNELLLSGQIEPEAFRWFYETLWPYEEVFPIKLESVKTLKFDFFCSESAEKDFKWGAAFVQFGGTLESTELGHLDLGESLIFFKGDLERFEMDSGVDVLSYRYQDFATAPLVIRFSMKEGEWFLKSETADFAFGKWSGDFTLRGKGAVTGYLPERNGEMEVAFGKCEGPGARMDPAALYLSFSEDLFSIRVSPVHFFARRSLSVIEAKGDWNVTSRQGDFSAWVQNGKGIDLGEICLNTVPAEEGGAVFFGRIRHPGDGGELQFSTSYGSEDSAPAVVEGTVALDWVEEILGWLGREGYTITGLEPLGLNLSIQRGSVWRGLGSLSANGLSILTESGISMESVQLKTDVRLLGLPSSAGLQEIKIGNMLFGDVRMHDIEILWALPTMKTLHLEKVRGKLESGRFSLEPFDTELDAPQIATACSFESIPIQLLFDILKEKRFAVEGTVSGTIRAGWQNGAFLVGDGYLQLDSSGEDSRFIFQDPRFLEQTIANLSGIPASIKTRLLDALKGQGIEMESLDVRIEPKEGKQLQVLLTLAGMCANESIEIPVEGLIVEQQVSLADLSALLGWEGRLGVLRTSSTSAFDLPFPRE